MDLLTLCCLILTVGCAVSGKTIASVEVNDENADSYESLNAVLNKLDQYERRIEALERERVSGQAARAPADYNNHQRQAIYQDAIHKLQKRADSLPRIQAFSAALSHEKLTNLHSGSTIIYNTALTNEGGVYSNTTGIFTAAVSGIYVFHFTTMVEPYTVESVELVRDGHNLARSYVTAMGESRTVSASALVVKEIRQGEQVWVRTFTSSQHGTGVVHGNGYTTFSGWIIAYTLNK
ncbi:uncharacterized protein LOC128246246 [Mya arenaria]|uniref:uncharacterized protein LOC128246246 n=1 Tax=Mya arenaria TaxID=6604 RepID=UPI0022E7C2DB|nr:uncharacterized protein LOC128246246 [Mya arenaria]